MAMSARDLAAVIESYLEADDSGNGGSNGSGSNGSGSGGSLVSADSGTQRQVQQLAQKTDQLQKATDALQSDMASIKNNLQMSAILPLLLNQSLTAVQQTPPGGGSPITSGSVNLGDTVEFKQADPLTALLPALLMGGGFGDSGSGGTDNSSNMLLLVLAISGKL